MNLQTLLPKDSWFQRWLSIWPTVESPATYQLFCGMSAMGSILGRRCWFDNDIFLIYPMINLLLIGPSGIGKSTAINLAKKLIAEQRADIQPSIISSGTKEKIHEDLIIRPKALLIASELANFFNKAKYQEMLIPYVTQLLDYEDSVELRTKGGGVLVITNPAVTVMGGSTVEWLQEQLPESAGTGGFLARFLLIAEEFKGRRVPLPGMHLTPKERLDLEVERRKTFNELGRILSLIPPGAIALQSYEAADIFSYWYTNQRPEAGYLAPFIERSREFVLRMAMLIALSRSQHEIEAEDIQSAIALYEIATSRLKSVVVPLSLDGKLLAAVLKAVGGQEMTHKQLYSALSAMAPANRIDTLIESHLRSGALTATPEGKLRRTRRQ